MKTLILIVLLMGLSVTASARAGWFSRSPDPDFMGIKLRMSLDEAKKVESFKQCQLDPEPLPDKPGVTAYKCDFKQGVINKGYIFVYENKIYRILVGFEGSWAQDHKPALAKIREKYSAVYSDTPVMRKDTQPMNLGSYTQHELSEGWVKDGKLAAVFYQKRVYAGDPLANIKHGEEQYHVLKLELIDDPVSKTVTSKAAGSAQRNTASENYNF